MPAPKLTDEEWDAVHGSAAARDDFAQGSECPICFETFRTDEQVLLSCSHVFHKVRSRLVLGSSSQFLFHVATLPAAGLPSEL